MSCARRFVWGNKDHAKMTHAKTAPVKRGLGAKRAHAKSQSVKVMVGRVCVWAGASGVCVHACGAAHPLAPRRGTALEVARPARAGIERSPARELNPTTPSTRLRAGPCVRGGERESDAASRPSVFVRGSQDPVEMTYSRLAVSKRGLLATAASAKS